MKIRVTTLFCVGIAALFAISELLRSEAETGGLVQKDEYTIVSSTDLVAGYAPRNDDGTINVVVEIPTGTNAKWEVTKEDTHVLKWEFKKGKPRVVKYIGYPGNYGMIPQTLLPKELGGDGDPLDIIALGPAQQRGGVVRAKLIGVLKLLDDGEQDDKLIAVLEGSALYEVSSLRELNETYGGVAEIVRLWFSNYKGPGEMEFEGFGDVAEAQKILAAAHAAFKDH